MKLTLAIYITLSRIVLTPFIVWCVIAHQWGLAAFLFTAAVATDFLDGYVARKYHQESRLGQLLDPIADKILIMSLIYAIFVYIPHIALDDNVYRLYRLIGLLGWFFIIKEIIFLTGASILYFRYDFFFKPTSFSRIVSVSEMALILSILFTRSLWAFFDVHIAYMWLLLILFLLLFAMIGSILLLLQYVVKIIIFLRKKP